jgi:hypothetical protein
MRQITADAVQAFNNNRNFKRGNTQVVYKESPNGQLKETRLLLHGNLIATKINGVLEISNAGWESNTTKERLNALPGVSIHQKNWQWYLNDKEWDGNWTKIN